jgi:hypothetical protein
MSSTPLVHSHYTVKLLNPKRKTSHVTDNEKGDLSLQVIALKM